MIRSINIKLVVACLALSVSFATGCGSLSEDHFGSNPSIEHESNAQLRIQGTGHSRVSPIDRPLIIDQLVFDETDIETLPEGLGELNVKTFNDPLHDGFANGLDGEPETIEEIERLDNGFEDGVATEREWKGLAKSTCAQDGLSVSSFQVTNEEDDSLFRAARFSCNGLVEDSDEVENVKLIAVVLGSDETCYHYEELQDKLTDLCGDDAEIISKEVLGSCGDEGEHDLVERVLFVCRLG